MIEKTENKTYWKCESGLCRGRLITTHKDSEVEARPTKEHNHVFVTLCRLSKKFGSITAEFHNFRYEHLWNHDFYAQESNIIFDIFFDIFSIF